MPYKPEAQAEGWSAAGLGLRASALNAGPPQHSILRLGFGLVSA